VSFRRFFATASFVSARIFAIAVLVLTSLHVNAQEKTIRLAMMENVSSITESPKIILQRAYKNLGYELEIVALPFARSLLAADNGEFDGEVARLPHIEESAKHLIRVPVVVNLTEYVPYVLDGTTVDLTSWDKINSSGLHVGARRGARLTEDSVRKDKLSLVNSYDSLLAMLLMGRIDVAIAPKGQLRDSYPSVQGPLRESLVNVRKLPVFASVPVYHYLHERNAKLVPLVAAEIGRIKNQTAVSNVSKLR
jgi:hypothetical protein